MESNMKDDLDFPQWRDVLFHSELPKIRQESFTVTLRWYLSFCKRSNIRAVLTRKWLSA